MDFNYQYTKWAYSEWKVVVRKVLSRLLECVGLKVVFDSCEEAATVVKLYELSRNVSVGNGKQ